MAVWMDIEIRENSRSPRDYPTDSRAERTSVHHNGMRVCTHVLYRNDVPKEDESGTHAHVYARITKGEVVSRDCRRVFSNIFIFMRSCRPEEFHRDPTDWKNCARITRIMYTQLSRTLVSNSSHPISLAAPTALGSTRRSSSNDLLRTHYSNTKTYPSLPGSGFRKRVCAWVLLKRTRRNKPHSINLLKRTFVCVHNIKMSLTRFEIFYFLLFQLQTIVLTSKNRRCSTC